jgi:hypothetical protein
VRVGGVIFTLEVGDLYALCGAARDAVDHEVSCYRRLDYTPLPQHTLCVADARLIHAERTPAASDACTRPPSEFPA